MLKYGFAGFLNVCEKLFLDVFGERHAVGVVDGGLDDLVVAGFAEMLEAGSGDVGLF